MQRYIRQTALILLPLMLALGTVRAYAFPAEHTWHVLGPARALPAFFLPSGVAVGPGGNVYVLDSGYFRVVVLSPQGRMLRHFGSRGSGPGQLGAYTVSYGFPRIGAGVQAGPSSLAVDRRGNVYVADWPNHRIEKFSSRGAFLAAWPVLSGSDVRRIAVAIGPSGNVIDVAAVYTGCPDNCASHQVLERRSANGRVLARWKSAPAQEDIASLGLAVGPDGGMWVGLRIQSLTS